ncbi:mavicyanin-like [Tasmannia lanceolata]|uniref:mavicyanin-like n=1 Tax=Tasmannia lanceolata TaxID=3420 RepID=UPI004063FE14
MAAISLSIFFLSAIGCALIGWVDAADHIVGGSTGWTIQSNATFYEEWARLRNFVVGDKLVFLFTTGVHNVVEVTESDFDACTQKAVIESHYSGPATIRLSSPGNNYFYCAVGKHCVTGQKLVVAVATDDSSTTSKLTNYSSSGGGSSPGNLIPASALLSLLLWLFMW